jgi:hypothetical protein
MDISQSALAWLYCLALLLGGVLGAFYDVLRITRVFFGVHYSRRAAKRLQEIRLPFLSPHKGHRESPALGIIVFVEDLLFCILAGILLILLFYEANNGKIRFPVFLCAGAGFLLYRGTVGRLVMLFSEVIAFVIEAVVRYLLFFLLYPVRAVAGWSKRKVSSAVARSARAHQKSLRRRFTELERTRGMKNACGLIPQDLPKQRTVKRGKRIVKGTKKTIQSHATDARASRRTGRGIHRDIRE